MRFTPQLRDLKWLVDRPIAHRGLHNKAGGIWENTAPAFANAIKGNYAIECDLQISADGEAMVFHDAKLDEEDWPAHGLAGFEFDLRFQISVLPSLVRVSVVLSSW